jgi:hypothetical protein
MPYFLPAASSLTVFVPISESLTLSMRVRNERDIASIKNTLQPSPSPAPIQFFRFCRIQISTGISRVFHISTMTMNCNRAIGLTPATQGARLSGVF